MKSVRTATGWFLFAALSFVVASNAAAQAPATGDVRLQLATVQNALVRDDRPLFEERLSALRSSPDARAGTIAQEMLPHYELALRLWDVQFTSAFFAEDSDLGVQLSQYAGFAEAMRGGVVSDGAGRRYFAASEARDFVARVAGDRLRRAGISSVAAVEQRPSGGRSISSSSPRPASGPARTPRRVRRAKD